MKLEGRRRQACERIWKEIDSYVNAELSPEGTGAVIEHLNGCPLCQKQLQVRIDLKESLQRAVLREVATADLQAKVMAQIGDIASRKSAWYHGKPWIAVAAVLLVGFAGWADFNGVSDILKPLGLTCSSG